MNLFIVEVTTVIMKKKNKYVVQFYIQVIN